MDIIRLNEDFISNLEVWWQSMTFVSRDRVLFLCIGDVGSELLVQVVKVNCKVSGPGRGNVLYCSRVWLACSLCPLPSGR